MLLHHSELGDLWLPMVLCYFAGTPPPMDQSGTETTIGIVLGVLFGLGVIAAAIGCYLKQRRQKQTGMYW